jgi:hypothetical protein
MRDEKNKVKCVCGSIVVNRNMEKHSESKFHKRYTELLNARMHLKEQEAADKIIGLPAVRVCSKCRTEKPVTQSSRNRTRRGGYRSECKDCVSIYSKDFYNLHKAECIAKQRRRENTQERYTCPCGSTLRKDDKARHEATQKHTKLMELIKC